MIIYPLHNSFDFVFYTTLIEIRKEKKIKWNDSDLKKAYEDYMNELIEKAKPKAEQTNE